MRAAVFILLTIWSGYGLAVEISDLYQVGVTVPDQSQESRAFGMQQALQQVLVKVSGKNTVLQNEELQRVITDSADSMVKSFRYRRDEIDDSVRLQVIFAANLVDQLLRSNGEPIWGKSRPLLLMWQAVESDQQRLIVSQGRSVWQALIGRSMEERGVPILWPTLDLEDELVLPLEKLWGLFKEDIEVASARYQADAVIAGRLAPGLEQGWQYQGLLLHQGFTLTLKAEAEDEEATLRQVADQVAGYFAEQYAVKTNRAYQPLGHQLVVEGIEDFADYYALLQYLNSKVAVNQVQLLGVDQTRLTLSLDMATTWQQLWGVLSLDKRLQPVDESGLLRWQ